MKRLFRQTYRNGRFEGKIKFDFSDIIKSAIVVINGTELDIPARDNLATRRDLILAEL